MNTENQNEQHRRAYSLSSLKWPFTLLLALGVYVLRDNDYLTKDAQVQQRELRENDNKAAKNPLLPDRLISIFGLESSGTKFITEALSTAMDVVTPEDLEYARHKDIWGFNGRKRKYFEHESVEIQHLSLPWGRLCLENPIPYTADVFYPLGCGCSDEFSMRKMLWLGCTKKEMDPNCREFGLEDYANYPSRFFVNITSHIRWYRERGVHATAVVIMRDANIAFASKLRGHCRDKDIARTEHLKGMELIDDALANLSSESLNGMTPEIVFLSYETLMSLGANYLTTIFAKLNVYGNARPGLQYKDGNTRYILDAMKSNFGLEP